MLRAKQNAGHNNRTEVNQANVKINGACSQFRDSGILCALTHGKLCLGRPETYRDTQKQLLK
jgi:hypothetical protein